MESIIVSSISFAALAAQDWGWMDGAPSELVLCGIVGYFVARAVDAVRVYRKTAVERSV